MFPEILQLYMLQGRFMRRLQNHWRGFPRSACLFPSRCTHAPTVPRLETRKFIFGPRGGQIVARHQTELEKFLGHLRANRVTAEIRLVALTTPRPRKTRQRIHGTHLQGRPQHIPLIVSLRNHLGICRSPATGAIGKRTENPSIRGRKIHAPWSTSGVIINFIIVLLSIVYNFILILILIQKAPSLLADILE